MGSSIFVDESGDESAREARTDGRPPSVFRRRDDAERRDEDGETDGDTEERCGDEASTMRVFSDGEVYEVVVDDAVDQ